MVWRMADRSSPNFCSMWTRRNDVAGARWNWNWPTLDFSLRTPNPGPNQAASVSRSRAAKASWTGGMVATRRAMETAWREASSACDTNVL